MKKYFLNKVVVISISVLCATSFIACNYWNQSDVKGNGSNKNTSTLLKSKTLQEVEGEYQLEKSFPVDVKDEDFDNSLLTNQMNTFYGYSGQGAMLVKSGNFSDFRIYVNGHPISFDKSSHSE